MCHINPMSEYRAIINTFQQICLPRDARHFWLTLFACANERQKWNSSTGTWEWPEGFFPICIEELRLKSAIERRAILKARETLKEMGFIDFIPGQGNCRPAMYKLNYLTRDRYKSVPDPVPDSVPDPVPDPVPDLVPDPVPQPVPIYKDIDKEKDIENTLRDDDDDFLVPERACARVRVCAQEKHHSAPSETPIYPLYPAFPYGRSPPFMVVLPKYQEE